jgi:hypothetical protein
VYESLDNGNGGAVRYVLDIAGTLDDGAADRW